MPNVRSGPGAFSQGTGGAAEGWEGGGEALEWLSDWLRQIIAVILLAGIIDLLLPSNAYQRYVRLVIGLIILLTLLSPILRLLQGDFESRLAGSFGSWGSARPTAADMARIEEQAAAIQQQRAQQAASLARSRLEEDMQQELERVTGLPVAALTATLEANGEAGGRVIAVEVLLEGERASPRNSGEAGAIAPIAPVAIEVAAMIELEPITAVGGDQAQQGIQPQMNDSIDTEAEGRIVVAPGDSRYQVIAAALSARYAVAPGTVRVYAMSGE